MNGSALGCIVEQSTWCMSSKMPADSNTGRQDGEEGAQDACQKWNVSVTREGLGRNFICGMDKVS